MISSPNRPKILRFTDFRDLLIQHILGIDPNIKDTRTIINLAPLHTPNRNLAPCAENLDVQHFKETVPCPANYSRNKYFLRCKQCTKEGRRRETSYRCKTCVERPPLCPGLCFDTVAHTSILLFLFFCILF